MNKIRVLLADDHAVLRAGLRLLIESQADMEVVAEAGDGQEAVRRAGETQPGLALVDLSMPGLSGVQAIGGILAASPDTRVLVLTMHDDPAYARASLAAGALGHVAKDVDGASLLHAMRAVHAGRTFVEVARDARAPRTVPDMPAEDGPAGPGTPTRLLSARERQVLELVAQGHTSREVATRLSLSVKTVETYRARLAEKLGLHSRADLVRFALEAGLLAGRRPPDLEGSSA